MHFWHIKFIQNTTIEMWVKVKYKEVPVYKVIALPNGILRFV